MIHRLYVGPLKPEQYDRLAIVCLRVVDHTCYGGTLSRKARKTRRSPMFSFLLEVLEVKSTGTNQSVGSSETNERHKRNSQKSGRIYIASYRDFFLVKSHSEIAYMCCDQGLTQGQKRVMPMRAIGSARRSREICNKPSDEILLGTLDYPDRAALIHRRIVCR